MRKLTVLCRIVDNLGDAGVALRFARYWLAAHPGDTITLCTDQISAFERLAEKPLLLLNASACATQVPLTFLHTLNPPDHYEWGDIIIEMFGTPVPAHWKPRLAIRSPQPVWVNLEYLTAENWIEHCHGLWSTDPATGWKQLFFFPGFTEKSGGLLGDEPRTHDVQSERANRNIRAFVFAYTSAPLQPWLESTNSDISFHASAASLTHGLSEMSREKIHAVEFVPQIEFDNLLRSFDLLFVRGEDSFVRAQLAARPFVWQIYPTEDGAHWTKLEAFFNLYTEGLSADAKARWKDLWWYWNGAALENTDAVQVLHDALAHLHTLQQHAQQWRDKLLAQCMLIERLNAAIANQAR